MSRRLAALLVAGLLAGCAGTPAVTTLQPEREAAFRLRQATVAKLGHWRLSGRMAFQGGGEALHASINWAQNPDDNYDIHLAGPAGQGSAMVQGRGGLVVLRMNGQTWVSDQPETLFAEHFGWNLPIRALRWWAVGLPAPGEATGQRLDEAGRPELLVQEGWTVEFLDYARRDGMDLPGKVFITNPAAKVKLVIDRWELGA